MGDNVKNRENLIAFKLINMSLVNFKRTDITFGDVRVKLPTVTDFQKIDKL